MTLISKHKAISLYYDNEICEKDVQIMLEQFKVVKYKVYKKRVDVQFEKIQYINTWEDYKVGNERLSSKIILG